MAQVIYPQQFWPAAPQTAPVGTQMGFNDLTGTMESASASGVLALQSASASLSELETSGGEVCAHAETLEDLALLLDRQMQTLIDRTRTFTTALRGELPHA
ncbi:hypothetical protein [Novispirillum itersonii]|uniref:Uncharacterized protein n=1 Tax=Novispirillum itersonii TaxID=189 RepID=A0A7W9ZEV6_NOVIT|nr:hypothetical protein [Novispirillum itersonii]MBB6208979.1 hypothetical protein [Novispirillum itersonii]